jgi:hypothetical protein
VTAAAPVSQACGARTARLVLGAALVLSGGPGAAAPPPLEVTAESAYRAGQEAEVVGGDAARALGLYRRAVAAAGARQVDLKHDALLATARVLMKLDEHRQAGQVLAQVAAARGLAVAQLDALAMLRRLRDELARETRRTPAAAPASRVRDVNLQEVTAEDAAAALSAMFGVAVVTDAGAERVSLHLKSATAESAVLALAFSLSLTARRTGQVHYVGRPGKLAAYLSVPGSQALEEVFAAAGPLRPGTPAAPVSLSARSAALAEVVRRLVDGSGVNIVAARTAQRVTLDLSEVGIEGALSALAEQLGWEFRRVREVYFLAPRAHLASYFPGFERRHIKLRFADAGDLYEDVQHLLAKERLALARAEVDVAGNALVLEGSKADLDRVARLVADADVQVETVSLELFVKDRLAREPLESARERLRLLTGRAGLVTLYVPPGSGQPPGLTVQLSAELTPRMKPAGQITIDLRWRLVSKRGGAFVDLREGTVARATAPAGTPLEIPLAGASPGRDLVLVLRPER